MTTPRTFDVTAPDLRRAWLLPGGALLLGVIGVALAALEQPHALWLMGMLAAVTGVIHLSLSRRRVTLDGGVLRVVAGFNSLQVQAADIDLPAASVVDLDEHTSLRPMLKTFGTSMPGYQAGHFRLRDRGAAFVLLTGTRKTLVLPLRGGKRVLLSVRQPEALLKALHDVAPGAARR
jgi:hypothetical protein